MAMPAPDFSLCLFLIPERVVLFSWSLVYFVDGVQLWYIVDCLFILLTHFFGLISYKFSCVPFSNCQQMDEQFKTLIVLSHYLEVHFLCSIIGSLLALI